MQEQNKCREIVKCKAVRKIDGNCVDDKKVVASQDLKKGEVVCYVCGTIFNSHNDDYKPAVGTMRKSKIAGLYVFNHRGRNVGIDPHNHISRFINHSCKPSCTFSWNSEKGLIEIRTKRALKKSYEITINYSRNWFETHNIGCQCGSDNCWGYIYLKNDEQSESPKSKSSSTLQISQEGKRIEAQCKRYERSSKLRKAVIERDGYVCRVCGKSLEETYGSYAKKLIEVHHGVPVSSHNGASFESSIDDMIAICPNCHRVLHHRFPEKPDEEAIEKLQNQIRAQLKKKRRK